MDEVGRPDCGDGGSVLDMDLLMLSEFDGLDSFNGLVAGQSFADSLLSSFSASPAQQLLHISPSSPPLNPEDQGDVSISEGSDCSARLASGEAVHMGTINVPTPVRGGVTLTERMLRALAMLKDASSGGAVLMQVWIPVRNGEHQVLTTSDQPFLLDESLTGYREVSRQFTFSATEGPGLFHGLPGRVFLSGMPEWTSNVMYYNNSEYLRVDYAVRHQVRGSLAMPVFNSGGGSCCAVIELVMTEEKDNFCSEMDSLSNALQSVNLSTVKARIHPQSTFQSLNRNQQSVFMEISDVMRAVCREHMLPLALAWIPVCPNSNLNVSVEHSDQAMDFCLWNQYVLCVQESASYVNDMTMHDFVRACAEHPLEKGQGVAGNAILSNSPFFSSNVRDYEMRDYPLAHHARKFGLHAAVAIRLRSTYTGNNDYVLEFFLPVMCKGDEEQQLALDDISVTMHGVCSSLRKVSDDELEEDAIKNSSGIRCSSSDISVNSCEQIDVSSEIEMNVPPENHIESTVEQLADQIHANKFKPSTTLHGQKIRSSTEKNVRLSVLQQYFAGSLKDAAKSIGVCPTTLKRICRQHGIPRWPSRKIKKVNRSLKKIQNVINSVHGVDGVIKYDSATGCLVSSVSSLEEHPMINAKHRSSSPLSVESKFSHLMFEPDRNANQRDHLGQDVLPKVQKERNCEIRSNLNHGGLFRSSNSPRTSEGPLYQDVSNDWIEGAEHKGVSRDSVSMPQQCRMGTETDRHNTNVEQTMPSSSMTDCFSCGVSTDGTIKKYFKSPSVNESNMNIIVKATYQDDTIRLKLLPSMKYQNLLEEIAKRLKLSVGAFQLKYKDDEDEWVILASDADLQECLDILDTTCSRIVKVQVRDVPK